MESVTGLIWIFCVCVSAPVVVLSGLLPVVRDESEAHTLTYISLENIDEDKWLGTLNTSVTANIPKEYDSTMSYETISHVISNTLITQSFSTLNPISSIGYYNGSLEAYTNHGKQEWKSDNSEMFDEILVQISKYNNTQAPNFGDPLEPGPPDTFAGIYIDIQRTHWIERNNIPDIHSINTLHLTISDLYQRTSTGTLITFYGTLDTEVIRSQSTLELSQETVLTSFPAEWSFGSALTSTFPATLGQSQSLYTLITSIPTFSQSQEPMETELPILTPSQETVMTGMTFFVYSNGGVMTSYIRLFSEEVTNSLPSLHQFQETLTTKERSQETLSTNWFTGLSLPEIQSSMARIISSSTPEHFQMNTSILQPPPPDTMTAGTHKLGPSLETILTTSSSSGQYQSIENTPTLRSSQETLSTNLLIGQSQIEIQSIMTSFTSSSTPALFQVNTPIMQPPPPKITTAGTHRLGLSLETMLTSTSSSGQYQFIENTPTLRPSQQAFSTNLHIGLSQVEIQTIMSSLMSLSTNALFQANTPILQPAPPETITAGTHGLGLSLETIINSSSSSGQYQFIENTLILIPSQEILSTNLSIRLLQDDIQSIMTSITSSSTPAHIQVNTSILSPPPPETTTAGTHRVGPSQEAIIASSSSFGQYQFMERLATLRPSQETLSTNLLIGLLQVEIHSSMTSLLSSPTPALFQVNTLILPSLRPETLPAGTHRLGLSLETIITTSSISEQYQFMENTSTLRSSQETLSTNLLLTLLQEDIQSRMTSLTSLSTPAQFQVNTSILLPAPIETMTAGTNRVGTSLETTRTNSSSSGQYQFIENTTTLRPSQETLSTNLLTGLSQVEIQSIMTSITSSYTPPEFHVDTSILPPQPPETMTADTRRLGSPLETVITSSFSSGKYQFIENTTTLRPSQEILSTSLSIWLLQEDIQSIMTSITSSSTPAQFQVNTSILPPPRQETMTAGTHRLGPSQQAIIANLSSFGQYQFVEKSTTFSPSHQPLSTNLLIGLLQVEIQSSMTSLLSSSTPALFLLNTPILTPPPAETTTAGTHRLGLSLETILKTSSSSGQYQFIENTLTLRPSEETLSTNSLIRQSQAEIQSVMTNITGSSTPGKHQVNTPLLPSPPSETMTAGTHRLGLSLATIIASSSSFGQYKFIEKSITLRPSQNTPSANLLTGLSHVGIQSSMTSITSLSTPAQFQANTSILPPLPPETMTPGAHRFGPSLETIITTSSGQYQFTENTPTLRSSEETLSTNLLIGLSQVEIESIITSITSLFTSAHIQGNKSILQPQPPETMTAGTHRLGLSMETIITTSSSSGQYQLMENSPTLRSSQEILSTNLLIGLSQVEIQGIMTSITSSSTPAQFQVNTFILPKEPPETTAAGTHRLGLSLEVIIASSSSFGQYDFIEKSATLRPSQKTPSCNLLTGLLQIGIQSSITTFTSLSTPAQCQVNTLIVPPPIPETMPAGTQRIGPSLETIITSPSTTGQYQFIANTLTLRSSQETLSTNLLFGLSQVEIQSIMTNITGSSTRGKVQVNTPILPSSPLETMTAGTRRLGLSLATIIASSSSFGQYKFIEKSITLRPSQNTPSANLLTGLSQVGIQSSMTSITSLSTPALFETNTSILPPPPPEAMPAGTHRMELSLETIITRLSSSEQYQFIEKSITLRPSQKTPSANLLTGLSHVGIQSSMTSITSLSTPAQFQANTSILPPLLPETMTPGTHRFGLSLETIITTSSSFGQYQFTENTSTLRSSEETLSSNLLIGLLQVEIQGNSSTLPPQPPKTMTAGTHRLGLSLETIITTSSSSGQYQFIENTPTLRPSKKTLSTNSLIRLSQVEIQSIMTNITSSSTRGRVQVNTPILSSSPSETMTAGTHRLGLSLATILASSSSFGQYKFIEKSITLRPSQKTPSANLLTGLSHVGIQSSMTSITSLSTPAQFQANTSILPPLPPATMTAGTHRFGRSLETIISTSSSSGQYQFIEKTPTLRSAEKTLSSNLLITLLQVGIQSSMTTITSLSTPAQFQVNTLIVPPPSPETMPAGTNRIGPSLQTIITSPTTSGQYQFIENTLILRSSQETLSTNLLIGLSQVEIQSIMTSITSSSKPAQFQVNTPILPSSPPETMTAYTHHWRLSLETKLTISSSFGDYQLIEKLATLRPSQETLSTNLLIGLLQEEIESSMTSITSLQLNTLMLPPQPPDTIPADTHRLGLSLETIIRNSSSFGQYQFIENMPTLRQFQETLSNNLFIELSQTEIQSSVTSINIWFTPAQFQGNTQILSQPPPETMTAGTHRMDLSLETIITSSSSFGQYQFNENTPTLRTSQGRLMTSTQSEGLSQWMVIGNSQSSSQGTSSMLNLKESGPTIVNITPILEQHHDILLDSASLKQPPPNIIFTGSRQSPLSTLFPSTIEETMLMSKELISNLSVSNITQLSTSVSYSNRTQQYYDISSSMRPITTSIIDTIVPVPQSSKRPFSSRPIVLASSTIKESKASEERTDTTRLTSNQPSEVTSRPSTKHNAGFHRLKAVNVTMEATSEVGLNQECTVKVRYSVILKFSGASYVSNYQNSSWSTI